jgi:hypothetical protein
MAPLEKSFFPSVLVVFLFEGTKDSDATVAGRDNRR